ncbi:hypothetical protein CBS147345_10400 [Aspergillus niger]|nr:hypothetical protein CBS147345_10400 [Aspergillus niger]
MLIQKPYLDVQFQLEHDSAEFSAGEDIKGIAYIIPRKTISPHQLSICLEGKVKIQIDRTENAVLCKGAHKASRGSETAANLQLLSCFPDILHDGDSRIPRTRAMEPND